MNEQELRTKWAPRVLESQIEFDSKALCKAYHEIKHGYIVLNPKERFVKENRGGDGVMGTI